MYVNAGVNNEDTVFLFTDTQIVQEEFLEDINNMLNSGRTRHIFTQILAKSLNFSPLLPRETVHLHTAVIYSLLFFAQIQKVTLSLKIYNISYQAYLSSDNVCI